MKIYPLAAISTVLSIGLLLTPSFSDNRPSYISVKNAQAPKRQYHCQQPSEIPLPAGYKSIKHNQIWCREVKKELRQAAPSNGYIANNSEWSKLWKTYRGNEELPKVNFNREVVLLYVHFDANTLNIVPVLSDKGDLSRAISFTELGMSDSPCSYMFMSVDRRGVKTIEGKSIVNKSNLDSIMF
jgi:hypothetical protein